MYQRVSYLKYYIIFFFLAGSFAYAQDDNIMLKGDMQKAYVFYNNALINDSSAKNNLNMCRVLHELNDNKKAKEYCIKALDIVDKNKTADSEIKSYILSSLGDIYRSAYRNNDIAIDYYKQSEDLKSRNINKTDKHELAELYRNMSKAYFDTNETGLALKYREKALELIKEDEQFSIIKASILNDTAEQELKNGGDRNEIIKKLEEALKITDNLNEYQNHLLTASIYWNLAKCYKKDRKNKDKYMEYSNKAADENEKFPFIEEESDKLSVTDMTIDELKRLYDYFPYNSEINLELGYRYIGVNDELSMKYFNEAVQINRMNAYIYLGIAGAYCEKYIKTDNREYLFLMSEKLREAFKAAPFAPKLYKGTGVIRYLLGDKKEAEKYFEKYVEYSDDKALAHCKLAAEYWETDDKNLASEMVEKHIEEALELNPDIDEIYIRMLISAYRQNGKNDKAEETINKYLRNKTEGDINEFGKFRH